MVRLQGWLLSRAGITAPLFRAFRVRKSKAEIQSQIEGWVSDAENALRVGVAHPAFVAGRDRGGVYRHGGLLWCDWSSLRPIPGVRQIVGHTPSSEVRFKSGAVCLDTHLSHYAILIGGELSVLSAP